MDNQAITWLKTNLHLNKMCVRWLDEIETVRFDVTHLPGSRNPTDPLSQRGFADSDGPAALTGDANAESQQELFLRLDRDAPVPARLATVRARWPHRGSPWTTPSSRRPSCGNILYILYIFCIFCIFVILCISDILCIFDIS